MAPDLEAIMIPKHQTPQYKRDARILRKRVDAMHRLGYSVACWRCGREIKPGEPYDAGHTGRTPTHLAPEHRHATGDCEGNRANGGAMSAAISHDRRAPRGGVTTWKL
jgi:hypothetical protein